jgi:hypothetical protein
MIDSSTSETFLVVAQIHLVLGKIYAQHGRREDAVREGKLAVEKMSISNDAVDGPDILYEMADIYMMVGDHDAVIDIFERLLSVPSNFTMRFIDLDPLYEELHDHPRYKELHRKYPKY